MKSGRECLRAKRLDGGKRHQALAGAVVVRAARPRIRAVFIVVGVAAERISADRVQADRRSAQNANAIVRDLIPGDGIVDARARIVEFLTQTIKMNTAFGRAADRIFQNLVVVAAVSRKFSDTQ
jgi:hypothetical protein